MKPIFLLLTVVLFATSCAQSYYFRPAADQPDRTVLIYNQGVPSLRATVPDAEIATDLTARDGNYMLNLGVFVRNDGDSLVTFRPEGVRVYGFNANGQRKEYRVFTPEQFIRRRNRQNAIIAGAVIVATVATVVAINNDAGNSTDPDLGNNRSYNDNNQWWWWAWSTPSIWISPEGMLAPYASTDGLLRAQTLYSGESVQGLIKVKSDPAFREKILVEVPVNGAYAQFVYGAKERRF